MNQMEEVTHIPDDVVRDAPWPDPTPEMLNGDPLFDAIWSVVRTWDVNVPGQYSGYCGATGNHARAIYDAIPIVVAVPLDNRDAEIARLRAEAVEMRKALKEIAGGGRDARVIALQTLGFLSAKQD